MTTNSFSSFFSQHFVALGALTAFLWMQGGMQSRNRDSFTTLSWLAIGVIIAAIDVVWGVKTKQWGGFVLNMTVLVFGVREIRSTLAQKRLQRGS